MSDRRVLAKSVRALERALLSIAETPTIWSPSLNSFALPRIFRYRSRSNFPRSRLMHAKISSSALACSPSIVAWPNAGELASFQSVAATVPNATLPINFRRRIAKGSLTNDLDASEV